MQRQPKPSTMRGVLALALVLSLGSVEAWSTNQKAFRSSRPNQPSAFVGKPSNPTASPQSPKPSSTKQQMLKNPGYTSRVKNTRQSSVKLSNSVLASCDTLPSFKTAHGLLSPETVMRLEEMDYRNEALNMFLRTYRKQGPLSCVPLLSDPDVLPHLTRAMREIAL